MKSFKIKLELYNRTRTPVSKNKLKRITEATLSSLLKTQKPALVFLSVFVVGEKKIEELNRKFRGQGKPTTVLSFPQDEPLKQHFPSGKIVLGDIFLCPSVIRKKFGQEKLYWLFWHGLLHLLGLTHRQMEKYAPLWRKIQSQLS